METFLWKSNGHRNRFGPLLFLCSLLTLSILAILILTAVDAIFDNKSDATRGRSGLLIWSRIDTSYHDGNQTGLSSENQYESSHPKRPVRIESTRNDVNGTFDQDSPPLNPPVGVKSTTEQTTQNQTQTPSYNPLNFFLHPTIFTSTVAECIQDPHCHMYYHHVGKTGGTTMESRMYHLFPPTHFKKKSCCFQSMLARFHKHKKDYCRAKFSSYQLMGWGFETVVRECMGYLQTHNNDTHHDKKHGTNNDVVPESRALAITTFREPIQRTLSNIHQNCNKSLKKRPQDKQTACHRCSYEQDQAVWDRFVHETNRVYQGLTQVSAMRIPRVQVLTLDQADIDVFFGKLKKSLPEMHVQTEGVKNVEKSKLCSFGMTSPMFKGLAESEAIYRNLTLGL